MHERQWRGEDRSRERSRDEEIDRRALEIMLHRRCNWVEAYAHALAEQHRLDEQGDVEIEERVPSRHRTRSAGRVTLSEQIGRAKPPRPGTVAPGRTTRAAALPAAVMRSAERAEIDPAHRNVITRMEGAFGMSFSGVTLKTDAGAAERAASMRARAYTDGREIGFANGVFEPGSREARTRLGAQRTTSKLRPMQPPTPLWPARIPMSRSPSSPAW